jgi:uncharacterized protein involved in exopolysaccharide biosynthesis
VALGFVDPLYTADTRILIEERESPLTRPRDQSATQSSDFDESAIQSQVEVLRSREIADAVIDKLDLTRRPEFDPARNPSIIQSLLVMVGLGENPADASIRQRVMESYFERLTVYPLQKSRVVGVEFSAPNPQLAAEVANAIADAFVVLQQDAKRQSAVAATAWLEQEIDRLRERVAEAEQAVADYRSNRGLFDVEQRGLESGNLSTQQLGDINAELARARAARAEAEARAQSVQALLSEGGALEASEAVLSSQLVQRLRERQVALRAQTAELSTTLLPGHPRIRALQEQVTNLEEQIRQEAEKILASLNTAARIAAARENSLVASLDAAKGDVSRSNDQEIQLRALEREAVAQRELLETFLGRYREAAARTDANYLPADARIISRAVAPREPSFPKKAMMSVAAAVAVLLLASAIVLLSEFTSGRAFRVIGYGVPYSPVRPPEQASPAAPMIERPYEDVRALTPVDSAEPELPFHAGPRRDADDEARALDAIREATETISAEEPPTPTASKLVEMAAPEPEPEFAVPPPEVERLAPLPEMSTTAEEAPIILTDAIDVETDDRTLRGGERAEEELGGITVAATEAEGGTEDTHIAPAGAGLEGDSPGAAELAEIVSNPAVRIALFAGAEGGEGAGDIAFAAARVAARDKLRCILVDVGQVASPALGEDRPGLGDLLAGDVAFGEAIRRDESGVHIIPIGTTGRNLPTHRIRIVVNALTHSYDKVIVVAHRLDDWPDEFVRPDVAAIVCSADMTEARRTDAYEVAVARGARNAIIVTYSSDLDGKEESAAA